MTDTAWRRLWNSYMTDLNFKYGNKMDKKSHLAKPKRNPNGIVITIPHFSTHWLRHTFFHPTQSGQRGCADGKGSAQPCLNVAGPNPVSRSKDAVCFKKEAGCFLFGNG